MTFTVASQQLGEEKAAYWGGGAFPTILNRLLACKPSSFFVRWGIWRDRREQWGERKRETFSPYINQICRDRSQTHVNPSPLAA